MAEPDVLIALPAFRGVELLPETLRSIRDQTYEDFRVLISVDGGDRETYEAARTATAADPRFGVVLQQAQLGWPGNLNWLISRCELPFVTYWQQDDLASTGYVGALRRALVTDKEASVAFADLQWFGDAFHRDTMPSIVGSPLERVLQKFELMSFVPLRGLFRVSMLADKDEAIPVTGELSSREEFVMLARFAARGPFVRVDDALYFKRGHREATTRRILDRPWDRRYRAWAGMGARILHLALELAPPGLDGRLLATVLDRLAIARPGRNMFLEVEHSLEAVREVAQVLCEEAGIDLGQDRWLVGEGNGLERPVHPLVHRALAAERVRALQLRSEEPPITALLGRGWWNPEGWGAWTSGEHAVVELGPTVGEVRLEGRVFAPSGYARVGWSLDGETATFTQATAGKPVAIAAHVPAGTRRLHLHLPDAISPLEAGVSLDHRVLSFGLERVRRMPQSVEGQR